jgi:Short C-terminal domain
MAQLPQAGQRVCLSYDPNKHARFEVLTPPGEETGTIAARTVELPYNDPQPGYKYEIASARESGRQQDDQTLEKLKQLGELRDSGVLTDAEFESQKAKVLADS